MRKSSALVVLCLLSLTEGCTTTAPRATIRVSESDVETRNEILHHIPLGASVSSAEKLMTDSGFTCTQESDKDGRFLYCDLQTSAGAFVGRRWQVLIRHDGAAVSEIVVSSGLVGL